MTKAIINIKFIVLPRCNSETPAEDRIVRFETQIVLVIFICNGEVITKNDVELLQCTWTKPGYDPKSPI